MLLKQYHAIADERGCCLRDMDFLVKKFQLLVPKNHIIALSWELYLSSDISSNCSKGTLVSRLSFSLEFEKRQRKKRELNLTRHFAKPFFLVTLDTWCYLGVPSLGWFLRTNAKLRFFFVLDYLPHTLWPSEFASIFLLTQANIQLHWSWRCSYLNTQLLRIITRIFSGRLSSASISEHFRSISLNLYDPTIKLGG